MHCVYTLHTCGTKFVAEREHGMFRAKKPKLTRKGIRDIASGYQNFEEGFKTDVTNRGNLTICIIAPLQACFLILCLDGCAAE